MSKIMVVVVGNVTKVKMELSMFGSICEVHVHIGAMAQVTIHNTGIQLKLDPMC